MNLSASIAGVHKQANIDCNWQKSLCCHQRKFRRGGIFFESGHRFERSIPPSALSTSPNNRKNTKKRQKRREIMWVSHDFPASKLDTLDTLKEKKSRLGEFFRRKRGVGSGLCGVVVVGRLVRAGEASAKGTGGRRHLGRPAERQGEGRHPEGFVAEVDQVPEVRRFDHFQE